MDLKEVYKKCEKLCDRARQHPKICIIIGFLFAAILLLLLPPWQVSLHEINNATVEADLENQYRATLAQILGGVAIGATLYYTWRRISIAQEDLKITQESQITERFTRAVDQLGAIDHFGNPAIEIRLGGIYALERISNESEKDYWPIMEILTAYVRKNSIDEVVKNKKAMQLVLEIQAKESTTREFSETRKLPSDVQTILTTIGRRNHIFRNRENGNLELQGTNLQNADLKEAHLEGVNFEEAHLEGVNFEGAYLQGAILKKAYLRGAKLRMAHLEEANLIGVYLEKSTLIEAHLERAKLMGAHLEESNLMKAHLEGATLGMAHLEKAILGKAHLERAKLTGAYLEGAYLVEAHLEGSVLIKAHLEGSVLRMAHLEGAELMDARLEGAHLEGAHLERTILINTDFKGTYLDESNLERAYIKEAINLTVDQLSKVKTLYNAQLDGELCRSLEKKYPEKYQTLVKTTEQNPKEKELEILSVTYVFRRDPVTDELRDLTADEFQQLIDKGIDPKHTTAEEIYMSCGWWPGIKIHYCRKGQETFVTNQYLNWTSAYETDK